MKRRMLPLCVLVVIAIMGLVSCGGKGSAKVDDAYLNVFMSSHPNTLDPSTGADTYGLTVIENILEPLLRVGEDESGSTFFIPAGAESWDISDDNLTYTFHLRDNKWNDGKPVTSHDYAFAIRRSADPKTACMSANFLFPLKNGEAIVGGEVPVKELGVATPDDKTLVLTLEYPLPYFLSYCAQRTYFPEREDWVEKYGDQYSITPETTPQCGPFILTDWVINSQLNFVKNQDYWDAENVHTAKVTCKILSDTNAIYNALMSGEIDYASVSDPNWRQKFIDNPAFNHVILYNASTTFIVSNCTEGLITSNAKIRQAFSAALDRPELIKACRDDVGIPAYSFIPPRLSCNERDFSIEGKGPVKELIDENPDPAALFKEGLKELGINKDVSEVTIGYMISGVDQKARTEAEYIQQVMKDKIGIHVDVTLLEWNEFFNRLMHKNYDMAILSWGAYFDDPSNFFEVPWPPAGIMDCGWINEEYNACVVAAQTESDPDKRFKIFKRADEILCKEDVAFIPVLHSVSYSFRKKFLKNVPSNFFNGLGWKQIDARERE